jgi:Rrf2 family protein
MSIISLTASHALRIATYLAARPGEWVRGAATIAGETGVPRSYAVRILHSLGRAGLVRTKVGCHGGYRLDRDTERTSALDVVHAVDGSQFLENCLLGHGRCSGKRNCTLHRFWSTERRRIARRLDALTLATLASRAAAAARVEGRARMQDLDRES